MNFKITVSAVSTAFLISGLSIPLNLSSLRADDKNPPPKQKVMILATGGTIAGKQASQSDYGYTSGAFNIDDLINAVPGIKDLAQISGEQVCEYR